jgi:hypothetical protein
MLVKESGRRSDWIDMCQNPYGYFVQEDGHVHAASIREFDLSFTDGSGSSRGYVLVQDLWDERFPSEELCPTFTLQIFHSYELVRQAAAVEAYYNVNIGYRPMTLDCHKRWGTTDLSR